MTRAFSSSPAFAVPAESQVPIESPDRFCVWALEHRRQWEWSSGTEADDIVGEVLLRVLTSGSMPSSPAPSACRAWLKTAARRVAVDTYRHRARRPAGSFPVDDGSSEPAGYLVHRSRSIGAYSVRQAYRADEWQALGIDFWNLLLEAARNASPAIRRGVTDVLRHSSRHLGDPMPSVERTRRLRANNYLRVALQALEPGVRGRGGGLDGGGSPRLGASIRQNRNPA